MHTQQKALIGALGIFLCVSAGFGQIIDHTSREAIDSVPQSVMDAIAQQRWFFTHASVGGNLISGLNDLRTSNPTRYQLLTSSVGYNSTEQRANDPGTTAVGTVYDCNRSNPGWANKITIFENSVNTSGWRETAVDVAMDKFCYIDQTANAADYISSMTALEASYPTTKFVYITMPLTTSEDSNNVLRNQYNDAVRSFCISNNKLLFDLADMEAHDLSGVEQTFEYGGETYQKLYDGYTTDGGHLDATGRVYMAQGWYATAAAIVPEPTSISLLALGAVAFLRRRRK